MGIENLENHPPGYTEPPPLVGKYIDKVMHPIMEELIKMKDSGEIVDQLIKTPILFSVAAASTIPAAFLMAIEWPLSPIVRKIQKTIHPVEQANNA